MNHLRGRTASIAAHAGVVALAIAASCTLAHAQAAEGSGSELVGAGAMVKSPADTAQTGAKGEVKGNAQTPGAAPRGSPRQGGSGSDPSSGSPSPSTNPE